MRFFRDCAQTLGSVLVLLLLFESGLRVTGAKYESSFYESDPVLYMTLRPNAQGWEAKEGENFVRINSYGMRDREHNLAPSPGTTRIALLGDSMVVAEQVPLDLAMAQILERKLNATLGSPSHSIEILNFAVGGYTMAQEYLALQNKIWAFHPDIIVLFLSPSSVPSCNRSVYPANIPFFIIRNGQLIPDPRNRPPEEASPEARQQHAIFGDLMNRVRLFQLIRKAAQDGIPQEIARLTGTKPARNSNIVNMWFRPPSTPQQEDAWQVAARLLGLMAQDAQRHGAEFWMSTIGPEIEENPNPGERAEFLQAHGILNFNYAEIRLQSIAAVQGIRYISLEPRLVEYAEGNHVSLRGFFNTRPNYGHWNQAGNAAAAEVVARSLLQDSASLNQGHQVSRPLAAVAQGSAAAGDLQRQNPYRGGAGLNAGGHSQPIER